MATSEHTINDAMAELLGHTRRLWRPDGVVRSENTRVLKNAAKRPDILVLEPSVSPVVVETEVLPALTVEADAIERLGEQVSSTGQSIYSSIAVRMPARLRELSGDALKEEIASARDFETAVFSGTGPSEFTRWPSSGWLTADILDISILAQFASVPPEIVDEAADSLVSGVTEASGLFNGIAAKHPGSVVEICRELRQEDGEQTRKMAMAILANAFVFQESLARGPGKLASVLTRDELRALGGGMSKSAIIGEWDKILDVNYWPIFDIARRILIVIPGESTSPLIEKLAETADNLLQGSLMRSHDLTGALFQRLIADRKFLAANYTTPSSAEMLVRLAISRDITPANNPWRDEEDISSLKIADFACGTGTLLSTAYRRISQLHEASGGDSAKIHPAMMASALVGCDVLPAASHLTASMLAGAHPTVTYDRSSILTVAYGPQPNGGVSLGSLELLDAQRAFDVLESTGEFGSVPSGKALGGTGPTQVDIGLALPHDSFDLILMNPPFTRDTGHEGKKVGVPNPMFAAFSSTSEQQKLMAQANARLLKGTSYHGNAGEGSAFLVLADRKLAKNGTVGLVMPLSLISGDAWQASRELLYSVRQSRI